MAAKTAKAWIGMSGVLLVAMKDTTCKHLKNGIQLGGYKRHDTAGCEIQHAVDAHALRNLEGHYFASKSSH